MHVIDFLAVSLFFYQISWKLFFLIKKANNKAFLSFLKYCEKV